MTSAKRFFIERLKLQVNESKSGVDNSSKRQFLGFTLRTGKHRYRRKIELKTLVRFGARVCQMTNRHLGISMEERIDRLSKFLRGWRIYFGFCEAPTVLGDLESWVGRRHSCAQWCQWNTYYLRKVALHRLGVPKELAFLTAWSARGPWRVCHTPGVQMALSRRYFDIAGSPRFYAR